MSHCNAPFPAAAILTDASIIAPAARRFRVPIQPLRHGGDPLRVGLGQWPNLRGDFQEVRRAEGMREDGNGMKVRLWRSGPARARQVR